MVHDQDEQIKVNQINFKRNNLARKNIKDLGGVSLQLERQVNCDCCMTSCT